MWLFINGESLVKMYNEIYCNVEAAIWREAMKAKYREKISSSKTENIEKP